MTTITEAHRAEAKRRVFEAGLLPQYFNGTLALLAQALAEPAWQPPVDPDLVEARECAAQICECLPETAEKIRAGLRDAGWAVQSALIAIKRRQS